MPRRIIISASKLVHHLTLQCSQRFLIELSTFIPRTCCRTAATAAGPADARPVGTTTPRELLRILGSVVDSIVEERARACGCCWVARRAADGRRESARRLVLRLDMRRHRATHAWFAIVMSCNREAGMFQERSAG